MDYENQARRDDSGLVATTVHPVIPSTPRPKTGRQHQAGFLASGLTLFVHLPDPKRISGTSDESSPVTVAGAAAVLHRVP